MLAPDISLYIGLSHLESPSPGLVLNPYYGVEVPASSSPHLKYGLAFRLFGAMVSLMAGRLWLSVLLWNLLWLILLWATAFLFFESWLPERPPELVALGLGMLLFFSFGLLKVHLSTWVHPSWPRFEDLALPFIRPFFPQVAIPLLLAYLGVQIKWLHTRQSHLLLGMVILQLTALAMFPYTTLMMAMITATIASEEILRCPRTPLSWSLLWYAIACGAADGIFFFRGRGLSSQSLAPVRLDFSAAHHVLGGVWALIAVLTLATALTRALPSEIRWPLTGLGLANLALLSGDLLFSESALMISHHAGYFAQATATVLVLFLASVVYRPRSSWRVCVWVITAFLAVNGVVIAEATYRRSLPYNRSQAELSGLLQAVPTGKDDLLIVRAEYSDDACAWIPLLSPAKVLYCRNASVLLTPEQNHGLQRFRQALYLYFTGHDEQELSSVMHNPGLVEKKARLAFFGGVVPFNEDEKRRGLEQVETDLLPLVQSIQRHDAPAIDFFRRYSRLIVIDEKSTPVFDHQRLGSYFNLQEGRTWGGLSLLIYTAK